MKIDGVEYKILDTKEKITVADSFVLRSNKIGGGNGEAKLYVGNDNNDVRTFFGNEGFSVRCCLLKKDLIQYLKDSENEYKKPEQNYTKKDEMPQLWQDRLNKINTLGDILYFNIEEQDQLQGPRVYVNSASPNYTLIRELSLPNITYLSAIKLEDNQNNILFYFRLFVDYFGETQHPAVIEDELERLSDKEDISSEQKTQLVKARLGQGKYRKALLEECPFCPITLVSDDRLLIASHIKPWVDSNEKEKTDPKNGFMFTPTFDFLFDRGFITFTDDKKMVISPWISKITCSRLNISPNKQYPMLPIESREKYLEYHRKNIFKS
ncbi:MAG: HNH endonuclease [Flavobacterium sp.]|jgi:predicted restriction endonuclease|nr:HNH endonuclease [Flavobacterium sp.]MCU0393884.1 HNH endonuclease [Thermoflexibacter sp.]